MTEPDREATFFNGRLRRAKRESKSIKMNFFAITVIFTALISSATGGGLVSITFQDNIDQILQSLPSSMPIIDSQIKSDNQLDNKSPNYQIPPNATSTIATKSTNATSSDHSEHHTSDSPQTTGNDDMNAMMESMNMYEFMQNGTMDDIMTEMMPGMVALMSDDMKRMMVEMMLGNMTDQNGMGNQTMIQEMDKMLQTMDKSLTILNTMVNASIANGNISNETIATVANSINQMATMMNQLIQMMKTVASDTSSMTTKYNTADDDDSTTELWTP